MPVRSPVCALAQATQQEPFCVAGRVIAVAPPDSFMLQDDTGCVQVDAQSVPALGAFVQVTGHKHGECLVAVSVHALTAGGERFGHADSDWSHLIGTRLGNLRKRQALRQVVRTFFDTANLLEVETPAIVPCPGMDVHLDALAVHGMPVAAGARWLHTSPEYQMKRLLTTGLPGIYQLGKAFRRGEQGRLHEPEFTLLEWYRSFSGAEEVMRDTEELVAQAARTLTGGLVIPGLDGPVDVTPPWPRLSVEQAFARYADIQLSELISEQRHEEERYYEVLATQIEPKLGRGRAMFLTDYPAPMASLARLSPRDPRFAERFEAYLDGVELCNGFSELVDPIEQRTRFERDRAERERLGRDVYAIDEHFMAALAEGIPPSGGNALGFDRLLMLLVGARHIDEVIALPASRM
jgi:elongation factor P--(R)-beta-lysine ligase